jgi:hypothetical protein
MASEPDETSPGYTVPVYIHLVHQNFIIKAKAYRAVGIPVQPALPTYSVTGQVSMGTINPVQVLMQMPLMISSGNATPARRKYLIHNRWYRTYSSI